MSNLRLNLNLKPLNAKVERAFVDMAQELNPAFTEAIEAPIYPWPRGESPRDIVDTHKLAESQQQARLGRLSMEFSWPREGNVSLIIHEGAVLRNGTVLLPRRWTQTAFERFRPVEVMANKFGGF